MTYNEYFLKCYPNEAAGYLKDGEFFPLENTSPLDQRYSFEVDPKFLLEEPDVLLHSHTTGFEVDKVDPRAPSFEDLDGQIKTGIEWGIVVTDGEVCNEPLYWGDPDHRPPLLGRDFIFNIQDCLSLAQDWFYQDRRLILPNQPRTPFWNQEGDNFIEDLYPQWGFKRIPLAEVQRGDVLFCRVRSPVINHMAIYLDNNEVIGHWYGRVSGIESFGKWASYIEFAGRHEP